MANCAHTSCACILEAGIGIAITGAGTPTAPYIVSSTFNDLSQFLRVQDTSSVDLTLTGTGTTDDPLTLRATSILKLTELTDVNDPSGGPSVGESPVWVGSGADGHWEFQIPPPAPAGATNVTNGLSGIGSVGDPVKVETSGVWGSGDLAGLGSDSTIGQSVYVDSAGKLRAKPLANIPWTSITGRPATFPPSAHTHAASDITDPQNLNAGRVNGVRIFSTPTSTTPPTGAVAGDLWAYPKGA